MLRTPHRHISLGLCSALLFLSACKTTNFNSSPGMRNAPKRPIVSKPIAAQSTVTEIVPEVPIQEVEGPDAEAGSLSSVPVPEPVKAPEPTPAPPPPPPPPPPKPTLVEVNENFVQSGMKGSVDILIVVDNSNSMREEQKNLSSKLNDLLSSLQGSDWQIGVITTSIKVVKKVDKCELTLLRPSDGDLSNRFAKAVQPGTNGSPTEEGIRQAVNGLRCPEQPWLRPTSTVAVLILSDEDNCSNGKGCNGSPGRSEQYLIDFVEKDLRRVVGRDAGFYGIFAPPAQTCKTAGNKANIYQKLVEYRANGVINYGNICDASYKSTLELISRNIAKLLTAQFQLKQKPEAGSVVVLGRKANGDEIKSNDYRIEDKTLIFNPQNEPALDSGFQVNYQVQAP